MKNLTDYINERLNQMNEANSDSKKFCFSFKDLPNAKDTVESLVKLAEEKGLKFDSDTDYFEITLDRDTCDNHRDKLDAIQDILQQYVDIIRGDVKNASSESFAQTTKSFKNKVEAMVAFMDNADAPKDDDEE